MTDLSVKLILSYLLGSLIGSLLIGRLRGGVDIRKLASGNPGATNALRTQGKSFAFGVLLIDIAKAWVATRVVARLVLFGPLNAPVQVWAAALCGLAVMLGHVYPLYYGFRGGKGVATWVGAVIGLDPLLLLPLLVTWLAAAVLFGFIGLASMMAAASVFIAVLVTHPQPAAPLLTFACVSTLLIIYTHRDNILRMADGIEPRARRLWRLRP